jgi:glycosyltransferase involved in cell wall biosynthesis
LEKQVNDSKLTSNIIFTGLVKDRELLSAYYKRSNLFLFPSIFDTCGLVVLEAGSFGLPAVTLTGTCASELLTDNKDGFIIDNRPEEWAKKFIELIKNPGTLQEVSKNAKKSFNKSWKDITLEYYELYKKVVADYKKNHPKK